MKWFASGIIVILCCGQPCMAAPLMSPAYPGQSPGVAQTSIQGQRLTLSNAVITPGDMTLTSPPSIHRLTPEPPARVCAERTVGHVIRMEMKQASLDLELEPFEVLVFDAIPVAEANR